MTPRQAEERSGAGRVGCVQSGVRGSGGETEFSGRRCGDGAWPGRSGRGLPEVIQCDQGTEFTSKAMDHWAYWNQVKFDFSRPGKPTDNAVAESFLASLRRECLTLHWFSGSRRGSKSSWRRWREDYNNVRPHSSLGDLPPAHFGAGGHCIPPYFISSRSSSVNSSVTS